MTPSTDDDAPDARGPRRPEQTADTHVTLTEEELDAVVREAVREEVGRRIRNAATLLAGAVFGLVVLPAVMGLLAPALLDSGVPLGALATLSLLSCLLLVAYGWRLAPFR